MPALVRTLPPLREQARRLIDLGIHRIAGLSARQLRVAGDDETGSALLVLHPDLVPASALAPLLEINDRPGFVVADMTDVDEFTAVEPVTVPAAPLYALHDLDRGDDMANWSPDEALPAIVRDGRTPLTLGEGIHWLLQEPDALERGRCFMTIGSRRHRPDGSLDARTPALWISNGTGRDGRANRDAPKVGWCWAGNRHTWLGFATASRRNPLTG